MRKWLAVLLVLILLCGCSEQKSGTTESNDPMRTEEDRQETPEPTDDSTPQTDEGTAPKEPWIRTEASPWDREGALVELRWNLSADWSLNSFTEFDGDLLLWGYDTHLAESYVLELCLIELDDGSAVAQKELTLHSYAVPQVLDGALFLCDNTQGVIYELDKTLREVNRWETEPCESVLYMGAEHRLYQTTEDSRLWVRDLDDGSYQPLLEEDPEVWMFHTMGEMATIEYFHVDTGEKLFAVLDMKTGEVVRPELSRQMDMLTASGDCWLGEKYQDGYVFYLSCEGAEPQKFTTGGGYFRLLDERYLMESVEDGTCLHLYDLNGKAISSCRLSENGTYSAAALIRSDLYHGYFLVVRGYDDGFRLLFWDTQRPAATEDLTFSSVPSPSEEEAALQKRCDELGVKYGLMILIGENCDTEFGDFTATIETDWEKVESALDILEDALSDYPPGFFRQLHYGSVHGVHIQLVSDLQANGNGRYGDGYAAFVSSQGDYELMVVDIDDSGKATYYHEFSHVIDAYLEWDAFQRVEALFSEEGWAANNPSWFTDYTYDYAKPFELIDYDAFTDPYATISPTEDRARVMEYAMADYGDGVFTENEGLRAKLVYYCRCIRDAFDTTDWPDTLPWERYLKDHNS